MTERVGWLPFAFVIVAALVAGVAGLAWDHSPHYGRKPVTAAPVVAPVEPVPVIAGSYGVALAPTRVDIPRLKASAPIVKVATDANRELEIPEDPQVVGWWSPGARPGAAKGSAVLASHINFKGKQGTFADIGDLKVADVVDVYGKYNASARKVRFTVTAVREYHKKALPYQQIFDQQTAGRLVLVTCGGRFDTSTGNYLDNIVVYAIPTAN